MIKSIVSAVTALALLIPLSVSAQHGGHHGRHHNGVHHIHHHHRGHGQWVAPLIGGVILGAVIAESRNSQAAPPVVINTPVPATPPIEGVVLNPMVTYYNCLVRVYDPTTGSYRNEVMTCVR